MIPPNLKVKETFAKDIEDLVIGKDMSYMEAIVHYCETRSIEVEDVRKIIDDFTKTKLQEEAEEFNLIEKSGGHLPI